MSLCSSHYAYSPVYLSPFCILPCTNFSISSWTSEVTDESGKVEGCSNFMHAKRKVQFRRLDIFLGIWKKKLEYQFLDGGITLPTLNSSNKELHPLFTGVVFLLLKVETSLGDSTCEVVIIGLGFVKNFLALILISR